MPFFFVFLITPIAVAIALYRRNPRRFLDGPTEDAPLRLGSRTRVKSMMQDFLAQEELAKRLNGRHD